MGKYKKEDERKLVEFPLIQLYTLNRTKPIVEVDGIDGELQWDY